jgi:hypothetical protein
MSCHLNAKLLYLQDQMRFKFYRNLFLKSCLFFVLLNPYPSEAAPKFFRRCLDLLSSFRETIEDGLENYINKPRYVEDKGLVPATDQVGLLKEVLRDIQIGYDKNDSAAFEHRWAGMWSKYTGNLWDIKYSDHPRMYGLNSLVQQKPDSSFFTVFSKKAFHFKNEAAPVGYIIGWESVSIREVEWAIHVVFVSGGHFWIFGKVKGNKKIRPWEGLP